MARVSSREVRSVARSPLDASLRAVDVALWPIPRARWTAFRDSELVLSRRRGHDAIDTSSGSRELDAAHAQLRRESDEHEYLVRVAHAVLEPRYGWAFVSPLRVVFETLNPKCNRWETARASITGVLRAQRPGRHGDQIRLPAAVSLRDFNEANYWHFFNDVFPKLLLADEVGIPRDVPAVIGARLARAPFFELVEPVLSRYRPLVVQDEQTYVFADELFWGATLNYDIDPFDVFLDDLAALSPRAGATPCAEGRGAFVTRGGTRARPVSNRDEIHAVCGELGLDVLEFDDVAPTEAPEVIRGYETIVGFHGAGLTNAMFRRGCPTRMGEIVTMDWPDYAYSQLAHHFGFRYRAMTSRPDPDMPGCYLVDVDRFRSFVGELLDGPATCR